MSATPSAPVRVIAVTQPTRAGNLSTSALSRWQTESQSPNGPSNEDLTSPSALITATLARQRVARETVFKRDLPFSLVRFFVGLVSLTLVFSDVFRSGLGMKDLPASYPALEPDEVVSFGSSWNYSVLALTKEEAANDNAAARVWSYKFDSTSTSWRAFAHYYALPAFPTCLLYQSSCPDEYLSGNVAFEMIDTLVQAVADKGSKRDRLEQHIRRGSGPIAVSLRTESKYLDRLHHYLLPRLFVNNNWRTNQALYYSPELLLTGDVRVICFPPNGSKARSPRFCRELWTNFQYSCPSGDAECQGVGLLYVHSMQRVRDVQARYPNMTVDLTFLESQEDNQVCRGGISSVGIRRSDVSAIIRARECTAELPSVCETVYVDDYRYETGIMVADTDHWYKWVATLRMIGQIYFYMRAFGLMFSCYHVYGTPSAEEGVLTRHRLHKACHLFMKAPMQCVVYGSSFPVTCYALAHLIDSPVTYQDLERQFISQGGVLNLKLEQFISYAFIQMRNVWIYSFVWHVAVKAMTSQRWTNCKHLSEGIVGVPEFMLSMFSSITLFAQYRSTVFRSAQIMSVDELPSNTAISWITIKYQNSFAHRGKGSVLLGGILIDLKFLVCMVGIIAIIGALRVLVLEIWYSKRKVRNYWRLFFLAPTPVSYSAGVLWPAVSMCVYWTSDFFCICERQLSYPALSGRNRQAVSPEAEANQRLDTQPLQPEELRTRFQERNRMLDLPSARMGVNMFRYIQHHMRCLHGRSDDMEANVAFMNLVVMSDPLVYLRTKFSGNGQTTELAYYQSLVQPNHVMLLPVAVVGEHNEFTGGLKLLRRVNASEMTWADLMQCG